MSDQIKILKKQLDEVDEMVANNDPELVVMVMSTHEVSAAKAKKLIKRYKQKYQFYKCKFCGTYAVATFEMVSGWWNGCGDNRWSNGEAYWGIDRVEHIETFNHDVHLSASICLECDKLNSVCIDNPTDLVLCTADGCKKGD